MNIQIHEVQLNPSRLNWKRVTMRYIRIKLPKVKDKERIWNEQEKSNSSHRVESPYDYMWIFQQKLYMLEKSGGIYSIYWKNKAVIQEYYTAKTILKKPRRDKWFPRKIVKKFFTTRHVLQEILKTKLQAEMREC